MDKICLVPKLHAIGPVSEGIPVRDRVDSKGFDSSFWKTIHVYTAVWYIYIMT